MFELLTIAIFVWLLAKAVSLAFKLAWGFSKIAASILITLALPTLILCLIFAGGILLLVPLVMVAVAAGILKACL